MYNENRRGPRTDPWGIPQFVVARPESKPFMDTQWLRLDRQDLNQSLEISQIAKSFNFDSIWWSADQINQEMLNIVV